MGNLTGRYAVVTGAGKGIGRAIAQRFLEDGVAGVALFDMDEALVQQTAKELDATGEKAIAFKCNVADQENVNAAMAAVEAKFGRIDILVNNAGITKDGFAMRMTDDQWQAVLNINLTAGFKLARAVIPGMMKRRFGRVIGMASIVGVMGNAGQANYSASKAGLIAMSKCMAQELASRGITFNCVAPGFIKTPMTDALTDEVRAQLLKDVPMGRLGTAEDIANTVVFLASDEAGYITGQTIHVNGGMAMI